LTTLVMVTMPIKDRLKRLRKAAGLTQQALAVKAGLSMASVIHLEGGRTPDPRMSTLLALAKALGVTVDELTGEDAPAGPADEPPPAKKRGKGKGGAK
jgi:transcriptional regulator with XRE-family HTH domain